MNVHLAEELLNVLGSSLESYETQNAALLQFLKDKGIVTDEQLAPYINQAGKASDVRWRAARARLERIFASATKQEEDEKAEAKTSEKTQDQLPKEQANPEQQKRTDQQPENTTKNAKSRDEEASAKREEVVETHSETAHAEAEENKTSPAKAENNAA